MTKTISFVKNPVRGASKGAARAAPRAAPAATVTAGVAFGHLIKRCLNPRWAWVVTWSYSQL